MKADNCGTWTEQKRHKMGWLPARQRPQCGNCKNKDVSFSMPETAYEKEIFRCKKGDFATAKTAICNEWETDHGL